MKAQQEIPGHGAVTLTPKGRLVAGSSVTLKLRYLVGSSGIGEGGSLYVCFPKDWERPVAPQLSAPLWLPDALNPEPVEIVPYSRRNLGLDVSTDGLGTIRLFAQDNWVRLLVQHAAFEQGNGIVLIYGDTTWGGQGAAIGTAPRNDQVIRVFLDANGDGNCTEVDGSPMRVEIVAGPPARFNAFAPSVVRADQEFDLRLAVADNQGNRPEEVFVGTTSARPLFSKKVRKARSRVLFRRTFTAKENNSKLISGVKAGLAGALRIAVTDETGEIFGISNPILSEVSPEPTDKEKKDKETEEEGQEQEVEAAEEAPVEQEKSWQIYWGDINGKSQFSDGARKTSPDEYFTYAREMAGLDFAAITDYMAAFNEDVWNAVQEAADKHTNAGTFVVLPAFEWSSNIFGHRALYFKGDERIGVLDGQQNPAGMDIRHLYAQLDGKDALIVPLHTFVWTNWGFHDSNLERLVETYSSWGATERGGNACWVHGEIPNGGVQQALAYGYRLGMIATSDTHIGMPGRCFPERRPEMPFKGGLTAVFAKELSRDAIFEALQNRRCYATTGARLVLRFSLNGHMMGSELEIPQNLQEEPRKLEVSVAAAGDIEAVCIVRNNQDIYTLEDCGDFVEVTYEDDEPLEEAIEEADQREVGDGAIYYYLRVVQKDGEVAWSSPIWVTMGEPEEPPPTEEEEAFEEKEVAPEEETAAQEETADEALEEDQAPSEEAPEQE